MDRTRRLMYTALGVVAAFLLILGGTAGVARADVATPSLPIPGGSVATIAIVLICVVVIIAVGVGVFFMRRARAKRRAAGPGTGS